VFVDHRWYMVVFSCFPAFFLKIEFVNKSATLKFCLLVFSLQHNPDSYSIYKKTKKN